MRVAEDIHTLHRHSVKRPYTLTPLFFSRATRVKSQSCSMHSNISALLVVNTALRVIYGVHYTVRSSERSGLLLRDVALLIDAKLVCRNFNEQHGVLVQLDLCIPDSMLC